MSSPTKPAKPARVAKSIPVKVQPDLSKDEQDLLSGYRAMCEDAQRTIVRVVKLQAARAAQSQHRPTLRLVLGGAS